MQMKKGQIFGNFTAINCPYNPRLFRTLEYLGKTHDDQEYIIKKIMFDTSIDEH